MRHEAWRGSEEFVRAREYDCVWEGWSSLEGRGGFTVRGHCLMLAWVSLGTCLTPMCMDKRATLALFITSDGDEDYQQGQA